MAKRGRGSLSERVGGKEERKLRARKEGDRSVWFGLGMFGMVGWAVAVPAVLGVALGLWLDSRLTGGRSWTLVMLAAGVVVGCFNAWYWIRRESGRNREPGGKGKP